MSTETPSGAAVERAMSAAMQVKAQLYETQNKYPSDNPDAPGTMRNADDRLLLDTLEGETDVFELIDRLAEQAIADRLLAEKAAERVKRIEERAKRRRDIIEQMLAALEVPKLERPFYTASLSHRTKPIITDAALLPEALMRHAPDMHAVARALKDGPVAGAELSNAIPVLTLRTA